MSFRRRGGSRRRSGRTGKNYRFKKKLSSYSTSRGGIRL